MKNRVTTFAAVLLVAACGQEPTAPTVDGLLEGPLNSATSPLLTASSGLVLDDFSYGAGAWGACGNNVFVYHEDASIVGGKRELTMRDAHSCVFGGQSRVRIDGSAQTMEWYGRTAPEHGVMYGTEIGTLWRPWSPSPNQGKGDELNLSLSLDDFITVEMLQVVTPFIQVRLRDGSGGVHLQSFPLVVGTNRLPVAAFTTLTAAAAADIDGISFSVGVNSGSNSPGTGNIFAALGVEPGVRDSDGDGINDDVDNCPGVANPGQEDQDGDTVGDVCDPDIDGDGVDNEHDAFPTDPTEWADSDGDGFGDNSDPFPNSDTSPTVVVGGNDSGVINWALGDGSTMADRVGACGDGAKNHGQFVSCVSALADAWKDAGLISGRDKGAIVSAAARTDVGKRGR